MRVQIDRQKANQVVGYPLSSTKANQNIDLVDTITNLGIRKLVEYPIRIWIHNPVANQNIYRQVANQDIYKQGTVNDRVLPQAESRLWECLAPKLQCSFVNSQLSPY